MKHYNVAVIGATGMVLSSEKDKDYNFITVFITTVSSFRQMRSF